MGIDSTVTMYLSAFIIIGYTFLGGFSAVCWTDFYQGLMILGSLLIAPIFVASLIEPSAVTQIPAEYWNPTAKVTDIISGFGWGLGYFGMLHIIIRFMSFEISKGNEKIRSYRYCLDCFDSLFCYISRYYRSSVLRYG